MILILDIPLYAYVDLEGCRTMRSVCLLLESDATASFTDPDLTNNVVCYDMSTHTNCAPGKNIKQILPNTKVRI